MSHPNGAGAPARQAPLDAILDLSHYHRAHESFYSRAPLEVAARLQTASRALKGLALRWNLPPVSATANETAPRGVPARYTGCEDLNDPVATETLGIRFMEGEALGDRHRIIVNNWQLAANSILIARILRRAIRLLAANELTAAAIRADPRP